MFSKLPNDWMCLHAAAAGFVECMSVHQHPKHGGTHVAATTCKDATDTESDIKLHYFALPADISASKQQL